MALQMLFQRDLGASALSDVLRTFDPEDYIRQLRADELDMQEAEPEAPPPPSRPAPRSDEIQDAFVYASRLVEGAEEHRQAIDDRIRAQAENWRLERMPSVDRNILRLGAFPQHTQKDSHEFRGGVAIERTERRTVRSRTFRDQGGDRIVHDPDATDFCP